MLLEICTLSLLTATVTPGLEALGLMWVRFKGLQVQQVPLA
jgi:hypothetical protein